jgi:site-specific recombinase XerD
MTNPPELQLISTTDGPIASVQTLARFARRLRQQGVTDPAQITAAHCQGFIDAPTASGPPPELTTRHSRRSALRMMFRTLRDLGHDVGDPTLDLRLPSRSVQAARPLTEVEVTLCRASSRMGEAGGKTLHRAVCWALGETTAVTSEISAVRVGDVDDPAAPRWVRLPGTRRHDPRRGELSTWGSTIVRRQLELLAQRHATPATPLTYRGQGVPGEHGAQSSVCNALGAVLDLSGLAEEPDVRPASLRNWAGRNLYESGMPIEHVARRMGARSLDTAAADIALSWRAVE